VLDWDSYLRVVATPIVLLSIQPSTNNTPHDLKIEIEKDWHPEFTNHDSRNCQINTFNSIVTASRYHNVF